MKPQVSPSEAPWANGLCEKMVHLTKIVGNAIMMDGKNGDFGIEEQLRVKVTPLTALESACEAHNVLSNASGFSPGQLVFGSNGIYATCLDNTPTALDPMSESGTPAEVLAFMQVRESARRNYLRHEYGDRLKKALRERMQPLREEVSVGDEIYYKIKNELVWRGPARVIGRDGATVIAKYQHTTVTPSIDR